MHATMHVTSLVARRFIVFDRSSLGYLNWFERLHCQYCAYANGLLACASDITARTKQKDKRWKR